MRPGRPLLLGVIVSLLAGPSLADDGLPTLNEALAISRKTGRPMFVMAGQKT